MRNETEDNKRAAKFSRYASVSEGSGQQVVFSLKRNKGGLTMVLTRTLLRIAASSDFLVCLE
jgi:hypothetical protein